MADRKKTAEFEDNLRKLEEASEMLRSGELSLDESLEIYNKSIMYYKLCSEYLKDARQKIEIYRPETGTVEEMNVRR